LCAPPSGGCYFSRDNKNYRLSGLENNSSKACAAAVAVPLDRGLHSLSPNTQAVAAGPHPRGAFFSHSLASASASPLSLIHHLPFPVFLSHRRRRYRRRHCVVVIVAIVVVVFVVSPTVCMLHAREAYHPRTLSSPSHRSKVSLPHRLHLDFIMRLRILPSLRVLRFICVSRFSGRLATSLPLTLVLSYARTNILIHTCSLTFTSPSHRSLFFIAVLLLFCISSFCWLILR
jgi:uncharacterized membrane protein YidH (DUF202 family)